MKRHLGFVMSLIAVATFGTPSAQAADGCKVLLCMAGNWQNIAECEPEVRAAMHDASRGRGWPHCDMGGNSYSSNSYVAPQQCPEQYRTETPGWNDHRIYSCPFSGLVDVVVEGQAWSRVWWSSGGNDTVTEWRPAAQANAAQYGIALDDRFTRDYAAWRIAEDARIERERQAALASN